MTDEIKPRQRYDAGLKAKVLSACARPGATVAGVASAHGLDADVVHKWRYQARQRTKPPSTGCNAQAQCGPFIALGKPSSTLRADKDIRIEVRRGSTVIAVNWPITAAAQCAAMLRSWL